MPLIDSPGTRETLQHLFPGIRFVSNVKPSGQRLVYFCSFGDTTEIESQREWVDWGEVVLKVSEGVHPAVIARMEKERELLNELDSPYFPRLLHADVFSVDPVTDEHFRNHLFITIEERVGGQTLQDCRQMFVRESACASLVARLVDGLQLLWNHPQRIIHRDLKPENILIRSNGMPVIIDLGIVREEGSTGLTATYAPVGPCTPAYASPEQLKNEKRFITYKSDFFSLGVIAYELLAGANPFALDPYEPLDLLVNRVLTLDPPTLLSLGRASGRFSALIEKLMAKEPYRRPRTVADLSKELSAITGEM